MDFDYLKEVVERDLRWCSSKLITAQNELKWATDSLLEKINCINELEAKIANLRNTLEELQKMQEGENGQNSVNA